MSWTKQEEELAKKEYLLMIDTLSKNDEFKHDWTCNWDDFEKTSFGKKTQIIKGDKNKYMRYNKIFVKEKIQFCLFRGYLFQWNNNPFFVFLNVFELKPVL